MKPENSKVFWIITRCWCNTPPLLPSRLASSQDHLATGLVLASFPLLDGLSGAHTLLAVGTSQKTRIRATAARALRGFDGRPQDAQN